MQTTTQQHTWRLGSPKAVTRYPVCCKKTKAVVGFGRLQPQYRKLAAKGWDYAAAGARQLAAACGHEGRTAARPGRPYGPRTLPRYS